MRDTMSRAFTSEEYEVPDMPAVEIKESTQSEDHDLVYEYTKGRNTNDPALPYEIGMNFLNGEKGFFKSIDFAVKWLKISTGMGCVPAKVALAEVYLADTKKYGYRDAAILLRSAKDQGSEEAGALLDMKSISDVKSKSAFTTYRLNAELGNTEAMIALAEGFEKEYYAKQKWKTAVMWYLNAYVKGARDLRPRIEQLIENRNVELSVLQDLG